ncbi:MAG: class I SAM-dependent methyltransferase [Acidobacteria bacterium]|nr:class I SAM-dependent methyltransferase [Acidobacteriota bacterium]
MTLNEQFGNIDIYLFDQLLRGRIPPGTRVLDAGCGSGRNLVYLLREGYEIFAADADPAAVDRVRRLAAALAPALPAGNFRAEPIEAMSFPDGCAGAVLSSAVLHFARDDAHFDAMLRGTWRALAPGGLLFCRLASSIGMEHRVRPIAGRRCLLPDGSERYLVDEAMLLGLTEALGGALADPIKTTVVQDQRCMTTWIVRKHL